MIELKNISKTYRMGQIDVHALRNASLKIQAGEFVAIMGPSGSGKSTLMHILGFLDRPDNGSYFLLGRDVTKLSDDELAVLRNKTIGFVFQQFHLLPRMTAFENAGLPFLYSGKRDVHETILTKLRDVGLGSRADHKPTELSGGEQQRVAIARALVNDPLVLFADEPTGNLDTKSEAEIMAILEDLNRRGKTIILVTHEREVAERAKRIITMRNGEIIGDEWKARPLNSPVEQDQKEFQVSEEGSASLADHFKQAVSAIFARKLRSLLSMLGILIGVAAVIAMLALGQGAKESITQRLSSLGSNLLNIRPGARQMGGVVQEAGTVARFTFQDAEELSQLPEVRRVSPSVRGRAQIVAGDKNWNSQLQGVGVNYAQMRASEPVAGRFFTEEEVRQRSKVAVIGATVVREVFSDTNPTGQVLKINRVNFTVIGILPEKGSSGWNDDDDVVIVPVTTAMYRLLGKQYVDSIDVEVKDAALMDTAQEAIKATIIKRQRLGQDTEDAFQIRNMAEIQDALSSTTKTMTWLLGSIAAISLLVGGIGIMNIMLVSVTERTKEIGLRKAIGARRRDIISQFLIEAIVMTVSGGVIGILVGILIAVSLSIFAGWVTKISVSAILLVTGFSIAVGIIFGLRPALQAAELNPIEALRYE